MFNILNDMDKKKRLDAIELCYRECVNDRFTIARHGLWDNWVNADNGRHPDLQLVLTAIRQLGEESAANMFSKAPALPVVQGRYRKLYSIRREDEMRAAAKEDTHCARCTGDGCRGVGFLIAIADYASNHPRGVFGGGSPVAIAETNRTPLTGPVKIAAHGFVRIIKFDLLAAGAEQWLKALNDLTPPIIGGLNMFPVIMPCVCPAGDISNRTEIKKNNGESATVEAWPWTVRDRLSRHFLPADLWGPKKEYWIGGGERLSRQFCGFAGFIAAELAAGRERPSYQDYVAAGENHAEKVICQSRARRRVGLGTGYRNGENVKNMALDAGRMG